MDIGERFATIIGKIKGKLDGKPIGGSLIIFKISS
jgi:hypothetical protein